VLPVPPAQSWLGDVVRRVLPDAGDVYRHVDLRDDAAWVGNRLAEMLPLSLADKQALLELTDPLERLTALEPAVGRTET
jgi:Lon protease-like protein